MKRFLFVIAIGLGFIAGQSVSRGSSISLTKEQRARLGELVRDDAEAAALFREVEKTADEALGDEPNPIALIQTRGRLGSDPVKQRTWKSLGDMGRVEALGNAWAGTGSQKYEEKIRDYLLAWATTNHSAGEPIDDTNLEPLITAYDLIHDDLSGPERQTIEAYLRGVAEAEIKTGEAPIHTNVNNWNSHRLKIVGLISFALNDQALIAHTVDAFHRQIQNNLLADGSSIDFHERDALRYHEYDMRPLVTLAVAARNDGMDFYHYRAPNGSSVAGGVAFLIPFVDGTKTHAEFVNSTVPFDRQRAAAGQREYQPGKLWDPHDGLPTLEKAELFDPSLLPLVKQLADSKAKRFPTWQIVVNSVLQ